MAETIFLFNRMRKIVVNNKGVKGIWISFHRKPLFLTLEKIARWRVKKLPKPSPKRILYWQKELKKSGLKKSEFIYSPTNKFSNRLKCLPTYLKLRSQFPKEVVKEAEKIYVGTVGANDVSIFAKEVLNGDRAVNSQVHSFFSELRSLNQAYLREKFPNKTSVTLYRGVLADSVSKFDRLTKKDSILFNQLSFFSPDKNVASLFGSGHGGLIFKSKVPFQKIGYSSDVLEISGDFDEVLLPKATLFSVTREYPKQVPYSFRIVTGNRSVPKFDVFHGFKKVTSLNSYKKIEFGSVTPDKFDFVIPEKNGLPKAFIPGEEWRKFIEHLNYDRGITFTPHSGFSKPELKIKNSSGDFLELWDSFEPLKSSKLFSLDKKTTMFLHVYKFRG